MRRLKTAKLLIVSQKTKRNLFSIERQ